MTTGGDRKSDVEDFPHPIAVGFLEYEQAQAKARQVALAGSRKSDLVENFLQGSDAGKSRDKAGERMGVSVTLP